MAAERALTPRQAAFVREYLVDLNATAAYRRAGYAAVDADVAGPRLLGNVGVAAAIQAGIENRAQRIELTQDIVIRGLLREALEIGEGSTHGARVSAWTTLARHLGMLNDKLRLDATDGLAAALEAMRALRPRG